MTNEPSGPERAAELEDLRARLAEAEEVLRAIRNGEVDALVVAGERGEQVYTLSGADRVYRQIIETMSEGAATLSADGVILFGNARLAEMLGRPLEQVLGTALRNHLPPADQQALDAVLAQARTAPSRREINLKTSEGRLVSVYLSASRLQSEGAEMVFCLVLTDLTEQKRHEQIVEAERLARLILEQAAEAIVVCDEEGRVIRASQAAQRFCDGSPLVRPFAEVFPLRTDASNPFHLAPVLQGETLRNVDVALDRQGQKFDLILNAGPLLSGQQILGCVVTLTNITERKRAETKLAALKDRLATELADMRRLHELGTRLLRENEIAPLLHQVLEASIELLDADNGNIQVYDQQEKALKMVASVGYNQDFLDRFKSVSTDSTATGGAVLERGERVIIEDVFSDPVFADLRPIFASNGLTAVQSTPLFSSDGALYGVLSTHWRQPHRPSERELRLLDLYAQQAARLIERKRAEEELRQSEERFRRRSEELARSNAELARFNRVAVGRELHMIELKQKVNDLSRQLGQPAPHAQVDLSGIAMPDGAGEAAVSKPPEGGEPAWCPGQGVAPGATQHENQSRTAPPQEAAAAREAALIRANKELEVSRLAALSIMEDAVEARKRLEHLKAVLGAVREIDQLITREKDRNRLLQQGCETLARTRGFRSAWTVLLAQDGRVEMAAEAATGEAFVGVRAQLARGELPDCCRRALASGGPVVMPNPAADCVACPLASQYDGTAAVAAPLRHEARIYGVLVAALPPEMANDPEEVSLLREVTGDLAFALRTIELDEARQKSDQAMHAMFDGAVDGMLLADAATRRFVDANPAACRMLGYGPEEITLLSVDDIHPADRLEYVLSQFQKQAKGEMTLASGLPVKRKDGSVFFADVGTSRFELEGRPHMLGIFRDITERKRMEQEHAAMEAQLRQHQKLESIGTLASGVAHEINNPINGVMNYAQLILDKAEPGSRTAEFAKEIIHETERVATIVHSLLQFSRHEKQAHSPARITEIIEQTLLLIRTVLRHDQITLRVDVPADLPTIKCRSQQIQQVLMNLLTNARDALNEKHPGHHDDKLIQVTCQPFTKEDRNWIRVTVEDHGPGIPAAIWERVFDPFFTTKPRDKGTGLGLSISHGIVKDHHGELWFETELGCWTRFHMDLPLVNEWTL